MRIITKFELFENANQKTTLSDMMAELSTWIEFTDEEKKAAGESGIDTVSNKGFAKLVKDWTHGKFDEDPEFVANELRQFATNKNWQYNP